MKNAKHPAFVVKIAIDLTYALMVIAIIIGLLFFSGESAEFIYMKF